MEEMDKRKLDCLYNLKIAGLSAMVGDIMQQVQCHTDVYSQLKMLQEEIGSRVDWTALEGSVCFE